MQQHIGPNHVHAVAAGLAGIAVAAGLAGVAVAAGLAGIAVGKRGSSVVIAITSGTLVFDTEGADVCVVCGICTMPRDPGKTVRKIVRSPTRAICTDANRATTTSADVNVPTVHRVRSRLIRRCAMTDAL